VVSLSLADSLDGLSLVSAHGDLSNVDIAVAHSDLSQGLLLGLLTGGCELSNLADIGSLGSLSTGVGVNFGIEDEDVDVLVGSQHMVYAAEADVVCPAVAAEDPDGLLGQVFLLGQDVLHAVAADVGFQVGEQSIGSRIVGFGVGGGIQLVLADSLALICSGVGHHGLDLVRQRLTDHSLSGVHTQTMLSVVLEQGVGPSGTVALFVDGVGRSSSGTAPDGGTAGGVGDVHP